MRVVPVPLSVGAVVFVTTTEPVSDKVVAVGVEGNDDTVLEADPEGMLSGPGV